MYDIKVYMGNYDEAEFYSIMGKFFAERTYKKIMPYLANDKNKIWYLYFHNDELVGFSGIKISEDYINFMDIYEVDKYKKQGVLKFICEHLLRLYKVEDIKVLSNNEEEIEIWLAHGFKKIGEKGRYQSLVRMGNNE